MRILVRQWTIISEDEEVTKTPNEDRIFTSVSDAFSFAREEGWAFSLQDEQEFNKAPDEGRFRSTRNGSKDYSCWIVRYVGKKLNDQTVQRILAIFDDIYRLTAWVSSGETEEERIARGNEVIRTFDGYAEELMGLLPRDNKEDE